MKSERMVVCRKWRNMDVNMEVNDDGKAEGILNTGSARGFVSDWCFEFCGRWYAV